ncbi:Asp23/Gls24 family envelope stress response protein [Streptomyces chrestomyceticus]|uniref:Asp23/Gls24 family envelope stress response protein n=1 Tax=Streptomyces chrestomyceticus TaxID=68185 RepID=UPI001F499172|nr:Asp23/Gls24 family envelope stress response protein [Streptomyces chrestomyceticus]
MSQVMKGDAQLHAAVLRAAAGAAKDTPGVAFLRPGLGELLRGTVARTTGTGSGAVSRPGGDSPAPSARGGRVPGVRADRGPGPGAWRIRVHLAVRRGHRALDVVRAVRPRVMAAVQEAVRTAGEAAPEVAVTVTVTDIT